MILIGGAGTDSLMGSDEADLLIGDSTAADKSLSTLDEALELLLARNLLSAKSKLGAMTDDFLSNSLLGRGGIDEIVAGSGDRWIQ